MLVRTFGVSAFILLLTATIFSQPGRDGESSFGTWLVPLLAVLIAGAGAVVFLRFRSSKGVGESLGLSTDVENGSALPQGPHRKNIRNNGIRSELRDRKHSRTGPSTKVSPAAVDIRDLPISRIESITRPPSFEPLPESNDDGLLAAIDELQDDGDADSDIRLVALRVLAGSRNKNSIDALSQIASYDLSANMRSKAVGMLADHDHESVFEPIVLACADPSREVRAAGARALVKVTFDRADAWARFAFSDDQYIGRQIARAAVESGIAERSFDRLAMRDEKAAYEAFALVYLLIRSGETEKIFDAVKNHRDLNVRLALLHSIKAANVAEVIPQLSAFVSAEPISSEVADKAREALLGINAVPAVI